MLFKVTFEKEIHIVKSANIRSLVELRNCVPQVFKSHPARFYLTYLDEEGDEITLVS